MGVRLLSTLDSINNKSGNILISPVSIHMAMGMALTGSNGTTKKEMKHTLGWEADSLALVLDSYLNTLKTLEGKAYNGTEFYIANAQWLQKSSPVYETFINQNKEHFQAKVDSLDFKNNKEEARKKINDWVAKNTNNKIPELLETLPDNLVLMLVNALYFKGDWKYGMDPDETSMTSFHKEDGNTMEVPMMTYEDTFYFHQDQNVQIADIPYKNEKYSMMLILPPESMSIDDFIQNLSGDQLQQWADQLNKVDNSPELYFPKFKQEANYNLIPPFKALGLTLPFIPGKANFSKIGKGELFISQINHGTYFKVDEQGTEAAAATSTGISVTSLPPQLRFDRPFVYLIREQEHNIVTFMGIMRSPDHGN